MWEWGRKKNQPPRLPARPSRESTPPGQEEKFVLLSNYVFQNKLVARKFPLLFLEGGVG